MGRAARDGSHTAPAEAVISRSIAVFAVALCAQGAGDIADDLPSSSSAWLPVCRRSSALAALRTAPLVRLCRTEIASCFGRVAAETRAAMKTHHRGAQ